MINPEMAIRRLRLYIKKEWIICFVSTILWGLTAHIYKLTNFLPNWDSLLNLHTDQNKTDLGRIFLKYACSVSSYYDLPWVNGVLCLIYLAMTSVCVCELLGIKRKIPLVLIGGLLGTFPTVTSTLAYNYTADGYFLALLCVSAAVLLAARYAKAVPVAAILFAVSLGIYQAYIAFAMVLILIYLINALLFEKMEPHQFLQKICRFAVSGILGCAGYWVMLRVILLLSHTSLSEYQNVDEAFSLQNISILYGMLRGGFKFLKYFFDFSQGISLFLVLNVLLVILLVFLFLLAFRVEKTVKEPWRFGSILFCMILIPVASYALYLVSPTMDYHNLMVMSHCLIYILPVIFYQRLSGLSPKAAAVKQWSILVILLLTIGNFILIANISYQKMHMAYEKSYGVIIRLADRIQQLPEAEDCRKIAVVGELPGSEAISIKLPPDMTGITDSYIIRKQDTMMGENVTQAMLRDYCGISYEDTTEGDIQKICRTEEFLQMGTWPEENSVAAIDDILVVKFGGENDE